MARPVNVVVWPPQRRDVAPPPPGAAGEKSPAACGGDVAERQEICGFHATSAGARALVAGTLSLEKIQSLRLGNILGDEARADPASENEG